MNNVESPAAFLYDTNEIDMLTAAGTPAGGGFCCGSV